MVKVIVRHGCMEGVEYSKWPNSKDLLAAAASSRHFGPGGSLKDKRAMAITSTDHALTEGMVLMWYMDEPVTVAATLQCVHGPADPAAAAAGY